MLGPYNTSDYPITVIVIPLIYIFVPTRGYPLRVGGLVVDVQCVVPLPEPWNFLLNMM